VYAGVGAKSSKSLWRNTLRTVSSTRAGPDSRADRRTSFPSFSHHQTVPSAFHRNDRLLRSLRTSRHA